MLSAPGFGRAAQHVSFLALLTGLYRGPHANEKKNNHPRRVRKHGKTLLLQRVQCLQLSGINAKGAEMARPPSDLCSVSTVTGFLIGVPWIWLAMT